MGRDVADLLFRYDMWSDGHCCAGALVWLLPLPGIILHFVALNLDHRIHVGMYESSIYIYRCPTLCMYYPHVVAGIGAPRPSYSSRHARGESFRTWGVTSLIICSGAILRLYQCNSGALALV